MRQVPPPTDPGPSNSHDVMFMDDVTEPHHDESIPFQMGETSKINDLHIPMLSLMS